MNGGHLAAFVAGALVFWGLATAAEKLRRAWVDLRHVKTQLKAARKILRSAAGAVGRAALVPVLIVAVIAVVFAARGKS